MSDDALDGDYEPQDYDSGPFCRHWSDPLDCEEVCARCGHTCGSHYYDSCDKCDCSEWLEQPEEWSKQPEQSD